MENPKPVTIVLHAALFLAHQFTVTLNPDGNIEIAPAPDPLLFKDSTMVGGLPAGVDTEAIRRMIQLVSSLTHERMLLAAAKYSADRAANTDDAHNMQVLGQMPMPPKGEMN